MYEYYKYIQFGWTRKSKLLGSHLKKITGLSVEEIMKL